MGMPQHTRHIGDGNIMVDHHARSEVTESMKMKAFLAWPGSKASICQQSVPVPIPKPDAVGSGPSSCHQQVTLVRKVVFFQPVLDHGPDRLRKRHISHPGSGLGRFEIVVVVHAVPDTKNAVFQINVIQGQPEHLAPPQAAKGGQIDAEADAPRPCPRCGGNQPAICCL